MKCASFTACGVLECESILACVNSDLSKVYSANNPELTNFCSAVAKCVDQQFYNIAASLPSEFNYFPSAIFKVLKSVPGYSDSGTLFFSVNNGTMEWGTPSGTGEYTDEDAQDAIGSILLDTSTINLIYNDLTPSIRADVIVNGVNNALTNLVVWNGTQFFTRDVSSVITGVSTINGDSTTDQFLVVDSLGNDFAITDDGLGTHTFSLPDASTLARGVVNTFSQTFGGPKTFDDNITLNGPTNLVENNGSAINLFSIKSTAGTFGGLNQMVYFENNAPGTGSNQYNIFRMRAPSAVAGDSVSFAFGRNGATGNEALINFRYAGNNSSNNRVEFQMFGIADLFNIWRDGNVNVGHSTNTGFKFDINGNVHITTINNATTDTDQFLVSDNGEIKYRTGAELITDLGIVDTNFANTDLVASGDRVHDWNSNSFSLQNALNLSLIADNTSITGNNNLLASGGSVLMTLDSFFSIDLSASTKFYISSGGDIAVNHSSPLSKFHIQNTLLTNSDNISSGIRLTNPNPATVSLSNRSLSTVFEAFGWRTTGAASTQVYAQQYLNTFSGGASPSGRLTSEVTLPQTGQTTKLELVSGADLRLNAPVTGTSLVRYSLYNSSSTLIGQFYNNEGAARMGIYQGINNGFIGFETVATGDGNQIRGFINSTGVGSSFAVFAGVSTATSCAILEGASTTRGFLPPRMTTAQKNAIGSPLAGLMVYDTTLSHLSFYDGSVWSTLYGPVTEHATVDTDRFLVSESNEIKYRTGSELLSDIGGESILTFDNGLTRTSNNVQLGGSLTNFATAIDGQNDSRFFEFINMGGFTVQRLTSSQRQYLDFGDQYMDFHVPKTSDPQVFTTVTIQPGNYEILNSWTQAHTGSIIAGSDADIVQSAQAGKVYTLIDVFGEASVGYMKFLQEHTISTGQPITEITTAKDATFTNQFLQNSTGTHIWTKPVSTGGTYKGLTINLDGELNVNAYGAGSITGTPAYLLAVDSSGDIIETTIASVTLQQAIIASPLLTQNNVVDADNFSFAIDNIDELTFTANQTIINGYTGVVGDVDLSGVLGVGVSTPEASAKANIESTTQGVLVPRMTEAQRNLIASPATSLFIYQTDAGAGYYYFDGTDWVGLDQNGTYVPTSTNIANVDASVPIKVIWSRSGNVVNFSGFIQIDATAASSATVELTLPTGLTSNFGTTTDAIGIITPLDGPTVGGTGVVVANATNNTLQLIIYPSTTALLNYTFIGSYEIIP